MAAIVQRLAVVALAAGLAVEAVAEAAGAASAPSPTWKGATTYPTTVTRIWSRTFTSRPSGATATSAESTAESTTAAADSPSITSIAIQTVTMYEPWPRSPNSEDYPYTMLQTAITSRHEYAVRVDAAGGGTSTATLAMAATAAARTATTTWILWNAAPTDLAPGKALPACGRCAAPNIKQDRRCEEHGLTTACHSQCKVRRVEGEAVWWCHKRPGGASQGGGPGSNDTREVALGRVCTDSMGYYQQLLEPCDMMDHAHDCRPCDM